MENKEEEIILQSWYRKRKLTTIAGIFVKFLFSFEYSSIAISALYYFKYTFELPDPKYFFSIAMGMMFLTSSGTAFFIGRYMDRTRNLRRIIIVLLFLSLVGNVIYALPFSKWLPVIARGICGLADGIQPVISGEFSRCYTKKELSKVLTIYHITGALMFAIAPSSPVLFQYVNFKIGSITFNQYNFVGLFQAGFTLLVLIISYLALTDLSKEKGYQIFLKKVKSLEVASVNESDEKNASHLQFWSLKDILKDMVLIILISSNALQNFLVSQLEIIANMAALYDFQWDINKLGMVNFLATFVICIGILVLNTQFLKGVEICYYLYVLTLTSTMIAITLLLFAINIGNLATDLSKIVLYVTFLTFQLFFGFGSTIYAKWIVFSLVPPHSRCYVDSIRYIATKSFACFGYFLAALVYNHNQIVFPIFAIIFFIYSIVVLLKRDLYFSRF